MYGSERRNLQNSSLESFSTLAKPKLLIVAPPLTTTRDECEKTHELKQN